METSHAGTLAATEASDQLVALRKARGDRLTVTIACWELRNWLRTSDEGKAVETAMASTAAADGRLGCWKILKSQSPATATSPIPMKLV